MKSNEKKIKENSKMLKYSPISCNISDDSRRVKVSHNGRHSSYTHKVREVLISRLKLVAAEVSISLNILEVVKEQMKIKLVIIGLASSSQ